MSPMINMNRNRIDKDSIITKMKEETQIPQDDILQQNADLIDNNEGNDEFD